MTAIRRLTAYALDWCVFAAWATLLFGAAWLVQDGEPAWPTTAGRAQLLGFALTTLPFAAYFTLCESSRHQATLGKRALGLRVVGPDRATGPSRARALARTVVKLAPWELGHTAAWQFATAGEATAGTVPLTLASVALAAAVSYLATLFGAGRTPYDRIADTAVVDARS